jgi:cellulose synthase/poly-beta-1,6-N-acetylglucosamine synthase-like glycosyltransferase
MIYVLYSIVFVICVYTGRHYWFTLNRLFGFQRHPYIDIDTADWPPVTVLVAAHNEEKVIANILDALMTVKYPEDKMLVIPVNDRSTDRTRDIIDKFVEEFPGRIQAFHRVEGKGGKAAALKDAMESVNTEVILIFDADYIPGAGLIKAAGCAVLRSGSRRRHGPGRAAECGDEFAHAPAGSGAVGRLPSRSAGAHEPPPGAAAWRHGGGSEVECSAGNWRME